MHCLPNLSYATQGLAPAYDAHTLMVHHDHHADLVIHLNQLLTDLGGAWPGQDIEALLASLDQAPEDRRQALRHSAGGHYNHALLWSSMCQGGSPRPSGAFHDAIVERFGSFTAFQVEFRVSATNLYGSGWAWLTVAADGLQVEATANEDNPLMTGHGIPILGIDLWEHSNPLCSGGSKDDYIQRFFAVVDWAEVSRRYLAAQDRPAVARRALSLVRPIAALLPPYEECQHLLR